MQNEMYWIKSTIQYFHHGSFLLVRPLKPVKLYLKLPWKSQGEQEVGRVHLFSFNHGGYHHWTQLPRHLCVLFLFNCFTWFGLGPLVAKIFYKKRFSQCGVENLTSLHRTPTSTPSSTAGMTWSPVREPDLSTQHQWWTSPMGLLCLNGRKIPAAGAEALSLLAVNQRPIKGLEFFSVRILLAEQWLYKCKQHLS